MAIYKVILNGQAFGQDIKNVLYYRTGVGIDISGLTIGGTKELCDAVETMVWTPMRAVITGEYQLQEISAYVYDAQTFHLIYQNPYTKGVGEGGLFATTLNGTAPCAIIKFDLEPHVVFANGFYPPKRGYMAFGPIGQDEVDADGSILYPTGRKLLWDAMCLALASNVETILPIPAVFFPIRVRQDKVGLTGSAQIVSWSDVRDATVRDLTSFRRSRQAEL